ncbi:hypothetical protein BD324DRAFT_610725 [Kockovaella imperatae]|uniref:Uncharacterized protein n=1 Tax=Kockovaella imperatae TaxID=4999 RepID=A0A1Y1U5I4_9TREE|nr:hypothetical protein BD324DRAFT_610725 [Kockovaella imperatae]ORX33252.1 hypothetical protein BD324DRAFT_610725 [Kockovaella imperatae]
MLLDRVIIVNRQARSDANEGLSQDSRPLNTKFNLDSQHDYFETIRARILAGLQAQRLESSGSPGWVTTEIPKIVYFEPPLESSTMSENDRSAMLEILQRLAKEGLANTAHIPIERMDSASVMEFASNADVLISVLGYGLTAQLIMPPRGTVIEIFPKGWSDAGNSRMSEALGHEHLLLLTILQQGNRVKAKHERTRKGDKTMHNRASPLKVDVRVLDSLLRKIVKRSLYPRIAIITMFARTAIRSLRAQPVSSRAVALRTYATEQQQKYAGITNEENRTRLALGAASAVLLGYFFYATFAPGPPSPEADLKDRAKAVIGSGQ